MQLTLEQPGFELHGSIYMWVHLYMDLFLINRQLALGFHICGYEEQSYVPLTLIVQEPIVDEMVSGTWLPVPQTNHIVITDFGGLRTHRESLGAAFTSAADAAYMGSGCLAPVENTFTLSQRLQVDARFSAGGSMSPSRGGGGV